MPPDIPTATYRLQLTSDFGFDDAARLVPYLKMLGISHLYTSPFLKARPGSRHGYDVVDHNALNPELGGEEAFARLSAALKEADMGLILDFVPNHVAVGHDNAWWFDVLEWGRRSRYAPAFDIEWELLPYRPRGGVLLPVLGRPYGDALTAGELKLTYDAEAGGFLVRYFDHLFPINPQRYSEIFRNIVGAADASGEPAGQALLALADEYGRPGRPSYAEALALKRKVAELDADAIIERGLRAYAADSDSGVMLLHRLLERQHYRLADWHLATSGINYRRFFDINELVGLRMEHPPTFRDSHRLVAQLIATDRLQGLRLDHIDGLFDPLQYLRRLRQLTRQVRGARPGSFYIVVEKIVEHGERLPSMSGVAGTTGYEWLNAISRLLLHEPGRQALAAQWRDIDPSQSDFATVLESAKLHILNAVLASEFNILVGLLARIAAGHYSTRDYAPDRLREALKLYVLVFPIYRTYVTAARCSAQDRAVIGNAIVAARRRWVGTDRDIFDFLRAAIALDLLKSGLPYSRTRLRQFALKLQQFTGPMMAKSLEDTALYRYHSLLALNEVGGQPTLPGLAPAEFHDIAAARQKQYPHSLTATATHDTKRGEDARMRILALSEIPGLWADRVAEWRKLNAGLIATSSAGPAPSPGHEYLLYQTLVGAWLGARPDQDFVSRIEEYAIKAAREGKRETRWLGPVEDYEQGLRDFVQGILDVRRSEAFIESFNAFAQRTALIGALNSLSQGVLKATMPGVPDFYQGTEFWDLSLVDPDNRRPVDFVLRRESLNAAGVPWAELARDWTSGQIKFALTHRLLALRRELSQVFEHGDYAPVAVEGRDAAHVLAFTRSLRRQSVLVVIGRNFAGVTGDGLHWPKIGWDAHLQVSRTAQAGYDNVLEPGGAEDWSLSSLFRAMPVAVLRRG